MKSIFKFTITLDDNDYFEFNKFVYLNSPENKKTLKETRITLIIISACFMIVFLLGNFNNTLTTLIVASFIISTVYVTIFYEKIILKNLRKKIQDMKKLGKLPYDKESIVKFDDNTYTDITSETTKKAKYSVIEKIVETDKYIYLFMNSSQANIIPKNVFANDAEKKSFLKFIKEKRNEN